MAAVAKKIRQRGLRMCVSAFLSTALCGAIAFGAAAAEGGDEPEQRAAETFVGLALRLGAMAGHEQEVDSYFGPEILRQAAKQDHPGGLAQLRVDANTLLSAWEREEAEQRTPRGSKLLTQVRSFDALLQIIEPAAREESFAAEAQRLYAVSVPDAEPAAVPRILAALEAELPGPGPLPQRLAEFYRNFVVPADRRSAVFDRALQECRRRTVAHWRLPRAEKLDIEWTNSVPAAWHRYQGGWRSTLQINPDAVALPGAAIDVACHEAYPGHHAQFLLQDQRAQPAGLPVEERLVLLRSPASVLREGAANFGIELAFTFEERVDFTKRVLFPLARLDPDQARRYEIVHRLVDQLSAAAAPIIAAYRDRRLSLQEAEQQLASRALVSSPGALLQFVDSYGAYSLGYTAVRDTVRDYVSKRSRAKGKDDWSVLRELVSDPHSGSLYLTH